MGTVMANWGETATVVFNCAINTVSLFCAMTVLYITFSIPAEYSKSE